VVGFLVVGMLVSPGLGSALAEASDVLGGQGSILASSHTSW
jgi:hypothetical protein